MNLSAKEREGAKFIFEEILIPFLDCSLVDDYKQADLDESDSRFYAGEDPSDGELELRGKEWDEALEDGLDFLRRVLDHPLPTPEELAKARDMYGIMGDDLEIDDDSTSSPSDDGTWVSAWVWVPKEELDES